MDNTLPPVRLDPWAPQDLGLLRALNTPEQMTHLGGPETEEQILARHERYVRLSADRTGAGRMFRITLFPEGGVVGSIGFWRHTRDGEQVYETGWMVLPGFQGRGVATAATRVVTERARAERAHRFLHAFPSTGNKPSNAVCRKAGFELIGERDVEYPPGRPVRCNDWRLALRQACPEGP
ncbi:GCN5 family acetyltransferase [Streptomyces eurocidicus]|uniref:GCN5 family acetyltransferase n=1 Tax=Streptomyces eurocidicus TaxID=66423 RepID=A0A2N8NWH6_STREU|nr:GNAT family N-acetyltransferase [Streptomyces eurocidicus]MBB5122260.1 RimJ/RimL family protein N-acetyltransferase [Streptomyces eurocidicus]MBF6055145.1 GNAT family N-acetyltransferase [Streptomyces eurocidicus]PNE33125.1 GCN5 family acetyltransferase [Streptomyces eurocidicus]